MPIRLCAEPRCPHPATTRGRCPEHARTNNRSTHANTAHRKVYSSKRWQITRRRVLFEQPLCPGVLGQSCGHIATDVHHIRDLAAGGDPWDRRNLEALCHACHSRLTRHGQQVDST